MAMPSAAVAAGAAVGCNVQLLQVVATEKNVICTLATESENHPRQHLPGTARGRGCPCRCRLTAVEQCRSGDDGHVHTHVYPLCTAMR